MQLAHLSWLFTLAALIHNAEEALWLPAWSRRQLGYPALSPAQFRIASFVVSLFFIATAVGFTHAALGGWACIQAGLALAMVLNALAHLAMTLCSGGFMPGTATALLLTLPTGVRPLHDGADS